MCKNKKMMGFQKLLEKNWVLIILMLVITMHFVFIFIFHVVYYLMILEDLKIFLLNLYFACLYVLSAWGNLANVYNRDGRIQDAETAYRNALKHRSNMGDTHYNL